MAGSITSKQTELEYEAGRTDYGRINFKTPATQLQPDSIEELARTLRTCNERGQPVTIRNTGHSTNGQTLTSETQISLSGLTGVQYDADAHLATAGAGTSWNDVIQGVDFPNFGPPIFPNNPGQLIHVGGTAAVGGVGFYCSRFGGFWNHVRDLKLVTMTGDIVHCSRDENPELFRYSLAGYGRVGVIGELGIEVIPSKPKVLGLVLGYFDQDVFERDLAEALLDPAFHGVAAQRDLSGWEAKVLDVIGRDLSLIVVLIETDDDIDIGATIHGIRERYDEQLVMYLGAGEGATGLELALKPRLFDKKEVVYFTTSEQSFWSGIWSKITALFTRKPYSSTIDHHKLCHPWTDCLIRPDQHQDFVEATSEIIKDHKMARYLEKESFLSGIVDIDSFVTFGIKRMWETEADRFPLSLDLPDVEKFTLGVAIMPNVPRKLLEAGLATSKEISDYVYSIGGKRYLYGAHDLSADQVEQHYGSATIEEWQRLKDEHDPNHLLNIDVIEHLDT